MPARVGTRIIPGHLEVVTAGTAVALITGIAAGALREAVERAALVGFYIAPDVGNTEAVVVGDKTVKAKVKENNGLVLNKGANATFVELLDIKGVFVDAQKSGESVSFAVVLR